MLVSQDYREVEVLRRADNWQPACYKKGETVPLPSVGLEVTMDQIYRRTDR